MIKFNVYAIFFWLHSTISVKGGPPTNLNTVDFWLVVASSHPAEAIEIWGPITLSISIFFIALFATQNNE